MRKLGIFLAFGLIALLLLWWWVLPTATLRYRLTLEAITASP